MPKGDQHFVATRWAFSCVDCRRAYVVETHTVGRTAAETARLQGCRRIRGKGWACAPCVKKRNAEWWGKNEEKPDAAE